MAGRDADVGRQDVARRDADATAGRGTPSPGSDQPAGSCGSPTEPLAALRRLRRPVPAARGNRGAGGHRSGPWIGPGRGGSPRSAARWQTACEPASGSAPRISRGALAGVGGSLPGTSPAACCPGSARDTALRRRSTERTRRTDLRLVLAYPPSLGDRGGRQLVVPCRAGGSLRGTGGRRRNPALHGWPRQRRPGWVRWRHSPERRFGAPGFGKQGFGPPGLCGKPPGMAPVPGRRQHAAFAPLSLWRCCCPSRRAHMPPSRRSGGMTAPSPTPWPPARLSSRNWKSRAPRGGSGLPGPAVWRTAGQSP